MKRALLLLLLLMGAAAPARAEPIPLPPRYDLTPAMPVEEIVVPPDARITLIATKGAAAGFARSIADELPEERERLEALLGGVDAGRIELRLGFGREEFEALQPRGARGPGWAAGLAWPALGLAVVDVRASARGGDVRAVVRHELAHVALGRLVPRDLPRWFTEGFAVHYAGEWSVGRSATLARATAGSALIDLEDLQRGWPSAPTDVDLAYAQSASVVAFLAGAREGEVLPRLVRELRAGAPFEEALQKAYGKPLVLLKLDWEEAMRARYAWLPFVLDTELLWGAAAILLVAGAARARWRKQKRLKAMEAAEEDDDPGPGPWDWALAPEVPAPPPDELTITLTFPDTDRD